MLARIDALAGAEGLFVMGAVDIAPGTLVLIGAGKQCWPRFKRSPEYGDGQPHPLDRWSKRVISKMAQAFGATDTYPSDGPPYAPFIEWALGSGQFFQSPTGMMIHVTAGLMISIRGALHFETCLEHRVSRPPENPCATCITKPCVSACPVSALSADRAYDVPACKRFLETTAGQDCMSNGCKVRRVCPVSVDFDRAEEQSAFHMASFKG